MKLLLQSMNKGVYLTKRIFGNAYIWFINIEQTPTCKEKLELFKEILGYVEQILILNKYIP